MPEERAYDPARDATVASQWGGSEHVSAVRALRHVPDLLTLSDSREVTGERLH